MNLQEKVLARDRLTEEIDAERRAIRVVRDVKIAGIMDAVYEWVTDAGLGMEQGTRKNVEWLRIPGQATVYAGKATSEYAEELAILVEGGARLEFSDPPEPIVFVAILQGLLGWDPVTRDLGMWKPWIS